jgi:hypothetical protein
MGMTGQCEGCKRNTHLIDGVLCERCDIQYNKGE